VEVPRGDRLPAPRSLLVAAAISAAITVLGLLVLDRPIAQWFGGYQALDFWNTGLDMLEWALGLPIFSWISGIFLVLGMIVTSAVPRLRGQAPAWTWIAAIHILTRIVTLEIKMATGRLRPYEWLAKGGDVETFGWVKAYSFPSGHVTLFASIAIPLAIVVRQRYPRLGAVLLVPAAFPVCARVVQNAHFLSDVTAAITLICLVAWLVGWLVRPLRSRG
jgi:membrane-associated phospholipid phosphatase